MKFRMAIVEAIKDRINPPSLEAIVADEMQDAQREAQQAQHVIDNHRFLRHMALSRMDALENWHHNRNIRGEESNHA